MPLLGSGYKTCVYCGFEIPSSVYRKHISEYHKDMLNPLPLPSRMFKTLFFFASALYLFGFSLSGVNVFGYMDALIPFERALCAFLAGGCVVEFTISLKKFIRLLGIGITYNKRSDEKKNA